MLIVLFCDLKEMELKPELSDRIIGMVSRDAECIPRSTLASPLPEFGLPDIANDKSLRFVILSMRYYEPKERRKKI